MFDTSIPIYCQEVIFIKVILSNLIYLSLLFLNKSALLAKVPLLIGVVLDLACDGYLFMH